MYASDVMSAISVFQNNETVAMLLNQTNPVGVELFFYVKNSLLFQLTGMAAERASAYAL